LSGGVADQRPLWHQIQARTPLAADGPLGKWHLVRTPGPEKGQDVVSVIRTAELLQSDPEFAGLTIRCRPKGPLQIAFVVITPFRPRTHPAISVSLARSSTRFKGDVIPPGSMVALPDEAAVLLSGPWQSASQLTVEIDGQGTKIHGIVSLAGLSNAISLLQSNCVAP